MIFKENDGYYINNKTIYRPDNFDMLSKQFKHFGKFISTFSIYGMNEKKSIIKRIFSAKNGTKELLKLMSHHSNGLKELVIASGYRNPLKYVDQPFKNVETLTFMGTFKRFNSETLAFNEIFPKLRQLDIIDSSVDDRNSIVLPFKQLESVEMRFNWQDHTDKCPEQFITLNPQIQRLAIYSSSLWFLDFLSKHSPNLQHLEYGASIDKEHSVYKDIVHFKSVKHLKIIASVENCQRRDAFAEHVTLEQLQDFETIGTSYGMWSLSQTWIDFIGRNVHLQKLRINWHINDRILKLLISKVPNVVEAAFTRYSVENANTDLILEFFRTNTNLKRLEFSFDDYMNIKNGMMATIQTTIEETNEGNVTITKSGCLIERTKQ